MAGVRITVGLDTAQGALDRLIKATTNLRPFFLELGEELEQSTKDRIASGGPAPDGTPWQPLSRQYLASKRKRESRFPTSILRLQGHLMGTIRHQADATTLRVGTDRIYGAVQQFGESRGAAGRTKRGSPIPWGRIPPRPYLGLSEDDRKTVLDLVSDYLSRAAAP